MARAFREGREIAVKDARPGDVLEIDPSENICQRRTLDEWVRVMSPGGSLDITRAFPDRRPPTADRFSAGGSWAEDNMPAGHLIATFEDRYQTFFAIYKTGRRSWGGVAEQFYVLVRLRRTGSQTPEFALVSVSVLPYERHLFGKIQNWYGPLTPPIDRAKRAAGEADRWLRSFFPYLELTTSSPVLVATKYPYQPHIG
jgi:hypothetical protein